MAKKSKTPAKSGTDVLGLGLADIKRVLTFMQEHGLEELAYERSGVRFHLRKTFTQSAGGNRPVSISDLGSGTAPATAHISSPTGGNKERATEAAPVGDIHVIKSPIVGTYYAAAGPEAHPFVAVGDKVGAGQVLCIIEAMKLMNEIESDVAGDVVQILVENGHPVEYGQPLFGIRPKGKK
jgi:acetyl-CoA carboxylase biotin carboxyl carrier protein